MLVLIDESGDPGFKDNSSRYFILTMIVFREADDHGRYPKAEQAASVIKDAMISTRHKPEFHFTDCSQRVRNSFFAALNSSTCDFEVYSLVVDKKLIVSDHLKKSPQKFYNFMLKQLMTHSPIEGATVKIDGQKSKAFRKALQSYLRQGNHGMLAKLKFSDSKQDLLIQLADMACGAVAYNYNRSDRLESDTYLKMMGRRVRNIWDFR